MHTAETRRKISKASKKLWAKPSHRAHMSNMFRGDKSPCWKKGNVGYGALHDRIRSAKGRAKKCIRCLSTKNVQWANIDNSYKNKMEDYISLCAKCHNLYDRLYNGYGDYVRKDNKSGTTGISWDKSRNMWRVVVQLSVYRKEKRFKTLKEAIEVKQKYKQEIFKKAKNDFKQLFNENN